MNSDIFLFPEMLISDIDLTECEPIETHSKIIDSSEVKIKKSPDEQHFIFHFAIHEITNYKLKVFIGYVIKFIRSIHPSIQQIEGYSLFNKKFENSLSNKRDEFSLSIITPYKDLILDQIKPKGIILNPTQKTIIAYGIVNAMLYLVNKNIFNGDLKITNIALDSNLYPILLNVGIPQIRYQLSSRKKDLSSFVDINITAPEIFLPNSQFTEKSDIYSFGHILAFLYLNSIPKMTLVDEAVPPDTLITLIKDLNVRPNRDIFYSNQDPSKQDPIILLIQKCWDPNPDLRPTFKEIFEKFEKNQLFFKETNLKKDGDFEKYKNYIKKEENEILQKFNFSSINVK